MDLGLTNRNAIVCASSRGLGKACAKALARAGANIVINGRDGQALADTAKEIQTMGAGAVRIVRADITTPDGQSALLDACPEPDILVNNNAGPPAMPVDRIRRDHLVEGVVNNMATPIELIQRVAAGMSDRQFGRIVNITSLAVRVPVTGLEVSSAARAGLIAFLANLARDLAGRNVTINHLLPGYFATARVDRVFEDQGRSKGIRPADIRKAQMDQIPAGRLGDPDEFGAVCAFLCSQHAGYITGQSILVDGGTFRATF